MKIILCGYHWTGCKALQDILDLGHEVFVYTHENPYHIPSLIDLCIKKGVQFSILDISKSKLPFVPDVICSIFYRYIIREHIIRACGGRIFNLHPSLLPKYRGCSSLTWALINGEEFIGFTFHYITNKIDEGRIIIQERIKIEDFDNQGTLYNRVMFSSMLRFKEALSLAIVRFDGFAQEGDSSYFKRGCPYEGVIDAEWNDDFIERFIRAMIYPPYAHAKYNNKEIKNFKDYLQFKII